MYQARILATVALAGSALFSFSSLTYAQSTNAEDWSPWYGCWHARGAPASEQLCIVPDGAGIRMITVADRKTLDETRVVADDRSRDVVQENCRGEESARWSSDHQRVFLSSELTCGSDARRTSSGIMAFTDRAHWVSVQAVTVDGQTATRRTEYEFADSPDVPAEINQLVHNAAMARNDARADAPSDADIDEAAKFVDDAAVQEWLHSSSADEVVSHSALDMMGRGQTTVVVERPVYVERPYVVRSCWDPFFGGFVIGVSRHVGVAVNVGGCGYRYYSRYSPWGYGLYGWHAYRPTYVVNRYSHYTYRPPVIIRRDNRSRDNRDYRDSRNNRDNRDNRDNRGSNNDHPRSGTTVTRGGYTRNESNRSQTQNQTVTRDPVRAAPVVTERAAPAEQKPANQGSSEPRRAHRKDNSKE